ncbi:type II toxin-antitoxin system prevent-host-death family antitoxin [Thalassotalea euphylliae]|uniref:Antitoxin n=1 Tax=Thalassotalea euphylliae TaxID=1655234 RepID=A0A3E0U2V0_9GAMM|nr:type II toxin-antitoxin system prevent-host-death family antitoxin [Thalassotalea euphylliae]REL31311.1 type II toxin-antitoxin system Phd/YefM family antitoxin [Thalassotalea euphylliae]
MTATCSINELKARAENLHDELGFTPLIVTQNGKSALVVQTVEAYTKQQEKIAFMELLLTSRKNIQESNAEPIDDFLSSI